MSTKSLDRCSLIQCIAGYCLNFSLTIIGDVTRLRWHAHVERKDDDDHVKACNMSVEGKAPVGRSSNASHDERQEQQ